MGSSTLGYQRTLCSKMEPSDRSSSDKISLPRSEELSSLVLQYSWPTVSPFFASVSGFLGTKNQVPRLGFLCPSETGETKVGVEICLFFLVPVPECPILTIPNYAKLYKFHDMCIFKNNNVSVPLNITVLLQVLSTVIPSPLGIPRIPITKSSRPNIFFEQFLILYSNIPQ